MTDNIASRYSHLIGQPVNDTDATIVSIDVYGPNLVKAILTDGTEVNVTPFGKD